MLGNGNARICQFLPVKGRWQQIVDHCDVDSAEEDDVEFVVAGVDPSEALEPAKEALDLVAPTVAADVVGPEPAALDLRACDRLRRCGP